MKFDDLIQAVDSNGCRSKERNRTAWNKNISIRRLSQTVHDPCGQSVIGDQQGPL